MEKEASAKFTSSLHTPSVLTIHTNAFTLFVFLADVRHKHREKEWTSSQKCRRVKTQPRHLPWRGGRWL